eukprot:210111-Pleurochrysis_carterae.AAC.1
MGVDMTRYHDRKQSVLSSEPAPQSLSIAWFMFAFDHSRAGSFPARGVDSCILNTRELFRYIPQSYPLPMIRPSPALIAVSAMRLCLANIRTCSE